MPSRDELRAVLEGRYREQRARQAEHAWKAWSTEELEAIEGFVRADMQSPEGRLIAEGFLIELERRRDQGAKLRPDVAETAFRTLQEATGEALKTIPGQGPKNAAAVERGAKGGKKGGKARAEKLSAEELSEIGRKGAKNRWPVEDEST